jgi:uncharacterized protein (DUF1810 family)
MALPTSAQADPFHLDRFLRAQEGIIDRVRAELKEGRKRTHWMWFIFPQIAGLGSSEMSQFFAISGQEEARAYLQHPVLGARLRECTDLVNAAPVGAVSEIFGYPDDLKFGSSMTLFAAAAPEEKVFRTALDKYFGGKPDEATLARLYA